MLLASRFFVTLEDGFPYPMEEVKSNRVPENELMKLLKQVPLALQAADDLAKILASPQRIKKTEATF